MKSLIDLEGIYQTPHFYGHFDFNDAFDHEVIRLRMKLNGLNLGFRMRMECSGNLD